MRNFFALRRIISVSISFSTRVILFLIFIIFISGEKVIFVEMSLLFLSLKDR